MGQIWFDPLVHATSSILHRLTGEMKGGDEDIDGSRTMEEAEEGTYKVPDFSLPSLALEYRIEPFLQVCSSRLRCLGQDFGFIEALAV